MIVCSFMSTIRMPSTSQKTQGQNLLSWRNSLCCLSRGWARVLPLFRLLFGFWGEMVDPCFIQAETCQELCLKMVQISTNIFCVVCFQKSGYPTGWEFYHILSYWEFYHIGSFIISRVVIRMEWTLSWKIPTALVMYLSATRLSPVTVSWTLGLFRELPQWQAFTLSALPVKLKFCQLSLYGSISSRKHTYINITPLNPTFIQ